MWLKDFDEGLMKRLEDPEHTITYLRAALEDDDFGTLFLALNKLAKARGEDHISLIRHYDSETNKQDKGYEDN